MWSHVEWQRRLRFRFLWSLCCSFKNITEWQQIIENHVNINIRRTLQWFRFCRFQLTIQANAMTKQNANNPCECIANTRFFVFSGFFFIIWFSTAYKLSRCNLFLLPSIPFSREKKYPSPEKKSSEWFFFATTTQCWQINDRKGRRVYVRERRQFDMKRNINRQVEVMCNIVKWLSLSRCGMFIFFTSLRWQKRGTVSSRLSCRWILKFIVFIERTFALKPHTNTSKHSTDERMWFDQTEMKSQYRQMQKANNEWKRKHFKIITW